MIHVNYGIYIQTSEVVLFPFDNYSIPFRSGLQLNLVEGNKYHGNPILCPGELGKPDCKYVAYYGTVIRVDEEFRMWYLGVGEDNKFRVCYAVSQDGIHWTKPNLGLVEYGGNTNNNLVDLKLDSNVIACVVIYDPADPDPDRHFKMSFETAGARCCVAYSQDGLIWKNSLNNPVIKNVLEQSGLIKFNGCYHVYGQCGGFEPRRCLVIHSSYDFEHWTEAVILGFRRDNIPPRPLIYGRHTGEQVHLGDSLWNRGNIIIGFYGMWHGAPPENDDRRFVNMDLGLIVSNDAIHFREPIPDFKIIPCGGVEERDWTAPMTWRAHTAEPRLMQGQGFENVGDQTYVWYSAWTEGMVRLATWPRDRLGYYSVPHEITEGQRPVIGVQPHFISCPLQMDRSGARVFVNANGLSENSYLTVEILDQKFLRLPEYSGDECVPLKKSGFRQPVIWRNKETLSKYEHPIRIQVNYGGFRVEDAQVYAIYISNE
jgi:hypothetical protein